MSTTATVVILPSEENQAAESSDAVYDLIAWYDTKTAMASLPWGFRSSRVPEETRAWQILCLRMHRLCAASGFRVRRLTPEKMRQMLITIAKLRYLIRGTSAGSVERDTLVFRDAGDLMRYEAVMVAVNKFAERPESFEELFKEYPPARNVMQSLYMSTSRGSVLMLHAPTAAETIRRALPIATSLITEKVKKTNSRIARNPVVQAAFDEPAGNADELAPAEGVGVADAENVFQQGLDAARRAAAQLNNEARAANALLIQCQRCGRARRPGVPCICGAH